MNKDGRILVVGDGGTSRAIRLLQTAMVMAGGGVSGIKMPKKRRGRMNGPGTAKNYNDRVSANGWNHYSDRADENGWNAAQR